MKIDKEALQVSSIGIEIALSIGIGLYLGWWLDKRFDTAPWLFILFLLAGIGSAIKAIIRVIKAYEATADTEKEINEEIEKITTSNQLDKEDFQEKDNIPE